MSEISTFSVRTTADVLPGFERDAVVASFAKLFGATNEKAAVFVDSKKLIKKNLSEQDANQYKKQLAGIGLPVSIYKLVDGSEVLVEQKAPNKIEASPFSLVEDDAVPNANTVKVSATVAAPVSSSITFSCPKCSQPQEKSAQCTKCGVFFEKLQAGSTDSARDRSARTSSRSRPSVIEDDEFNPIMLVLPIVAAIVGAFLWKLIAYSLGYEIGFVAWGIGGAIGAAAGFAGARGELSGIACAVLVVLSIFGGKYMTMSSFQTDIETAMHEATGQEEWNVQDIVYQASSEAKAYVAMAKDDKSIRKFMVKYDYTEEMSSSAISEEELDFFKTEIGPELVVFAQTVDSEEFETDIAALTNLDQISTTSLVMESLGLLDLLFLFLGVSTAFAMGRAGRE